jgi:hypothetical protein
MADDTAPNVSSRVQDLGVLFSAPLVSVIEADVLASREFANFIRDYGFISSDDGSGSHFGALRTVTFTYNRPGANGLEEAVVEIPLLSLVPLPLLQVMDAEFTFNVRVLESDTTLGAPPPLVGGSDQPAQSPSSQAPRVRAMLAQAPSSSGTTSGAQSRSELDANMAVRLSMKQADVPAGISALLNVMSQSIHSRSSNT